MDGKKIRDDIQYNERLERTSRIWLGVIFLLFLAAFCAILHSYYDIMIRPEFEDPALMKKMAQRSSGNMTVGVGGENELDGHRGYIYDRHGYELAISIETPTIAAYPQKMPESKKDDIARRLSEALDKDYALIREQLNTPHMVYLDRRTTPEKGAAVKKLRLPRNQVEIKRESKRYYPGQEIAGQIIGFAGTDNAGLEGIEAAYDKYLRGSVIQISGRHDRKGNIILTDESPRLNELEGSSIVLTIDQYIQKVAETAITRAAQEWQAKAALAIVMDPKTGEILAMANYPRFNPNRFMDYKNDRDSMRNRTVLDAYEPGSMMKVFTYAAVVDQTHLSPATPVDQFHGALKIGKHTIKDTHSIPNMTAETVVSESSNIGAYMLAKKIGRDKFYEYLKAFGFGSRTGINIAGESAGILFPPSSWAEIQFSNIAFGHGIAVSPIQLVTALSAIANGGTLMQPWLISEIRDKDGNLVQEGNPVERRRVISEKTARQVRQAMERVVTEGTAKRAYVGGYRVGGKTGTAQKVDPRTHTYSNRYMANFEGIAPIDDPNIAVVIMVDEPRLGHAGGFVAAPVFAEIATHVLPYRGVFPKGVMSGRIDPFELMKLSEGAQAALAAQEPVQVPENALVAGDPWKEDGCTEPVTTPDFRGMTAYAALRLAASTCLDIEFENAGYVISQWPDAGSVVQPHTRMLLKLKGNYKNLN